MVQDSILVREDYMGNKDKVGGYVSNTGYTYKTCTHVHSPIKIGDYTMYATGSRHMTQAVCNMYVPKDLGVYLDIGTWQGVRLVAPLSHNETKSKIPVLNDYYGEVIYIRWPDFQGLGQDRFKRLVNMVYRSLQKDKTVEVGCIGAHGRTGTLLAGLLVKIEGLGAWEAIKAVRDRYCAMAIETLAQEDMVFVYSGEPIPVSTKTAYNIPTYTSGGYGSYDKDYTGYSKLFETADDGEYWNFCDEGLDCEKYGHCRHYDEETDTCCDCNYLSEMSDEYDAIAIGDEEYAGKDIDDETVMKLLEVIADSKELVERQKQQKGGRNFYALD